MKKFINTFRIWFGKKLIDWGFSTLTKMNEYDWDPKKQRYPGSIKQLKYMVNSWLVINGMRMETKGLKYSDWAGLGNKYYDKNFDLNPKFKYKRRKKDNGPDDYENFFPKWE